MFLFTGLSTDREFESPLTNNCCVPLDDGAQKPVFIYRVKNARGKRNGWDWLMDPYLGLEPDGHRALAGTHTHTQLK